MTLLGRRGVIAGGGGGGASSIFGFVDDTDGITVKNANFTVPVPEATETGDVLILIAGGGYNQPITEVTTTDWDLVGSGQKASISHATPRADVLTTVYDGVASQWLFNRADEAAGNGIYNSAWWCGAYRGVSPTDFALVLQDSGGYPALSPSILLPVGDSFMLYGGVGYNMQGSGGGGFNPPGSATAVRLETYPGLDVAVFEEAIVGHSGGASGTRNVAPYQGCVTFALRLVDSTP